MKIIDRTLTTLDEYCENNDVLLVQLCEKLVCSGADFIELSIPALKEIGIDNLPQADYILNIKSPHEKFDFPIFKKFSCNYAGEYNYDDIIVEFNIKDVEEINDICCDKKSMIRITGLDNLILHDYKQYFELLLSKFGENLDICATNDFDCATAISVEWAIFGGNSLSTSYAGIGGFAPLEEVILALRLKISRDEDKSLKVLSEIRDIYTQITNRTIADNKPVIGGGIFTVEAGIHVDGISKNPDTYEPYDPKIIGKMRSIVIGKHSGKKAIELKLAENNLKASDRWLQIILNSIRDESIKLGRSLRDDEFLKLTREAVTYEEAKIHN